MTDTNETTVADDTEEVETPEVELTTDTDWEAEAKKARGIAQRLRTKVIKLSEKKVEVEPTVVPAKNEQKTGGLDETQLDYLDLKGITDDADVKIVENIVKKTGQTVRQVLKDEYVIAKLESNKKAREVQNALPSNTKRGGSTGDSLEQAIAKFERTKELPDDFELRSKVLDSISSKGDITKPSWRR